MPFFRRHKSDSKPPRKSRLRELFSRRSTGNVSPESSSYSSSDPIESTASSSVDDSSLEAVRKKFGEGVYEEIKYSSKTPPESTMPGDNGERTLVKREQTGLAPQPTRPRKASIPELFPSTQKDMDAVKENRLLNSIAKIPTPTKKPRPAEEPTAPIYRSHTVETMEAIEEINDLIKKLSPPTPRKSRKQENPAESPESSPYSSIVWPSAPTAAQSRSNSPTYTVVPLTRSKASFNLPQYMAKAKASYSSTSSSSSPEQRPKKLLPRITNPNGYVDAPFDPDPAPQDRSKLSLDQVDDYLKRSSRNLSAPLMAEERPIVHAQSAPVRTQGFVEKLQKQYSFTLSDDGKTLQGPLGEKQASHDFARTLLKSYSRTLLPEKACYKDTRAVISYTPEQRATTHTLKITSERDSNGQRTGKQSIAIELNPNLTSHIRQ
jgi:hypothetical protein